MNKRIMLHCRNNSRKTEKSIPSTHLWPPTFLAWYRHFNDK